jgi:integrase
MRTKFTKGKIDKFECSQQKSAAFLWDSEVPGFGIKASPGGAKNYVLEGRLKSGSNIRITIGDTKSWALNAAQVKARQLQTLIDQGLDPRIVRAQEAAKLQASKADLQRQNITFSEAWNSYISIRKHKWGERTYADHVNIISNKGTPAPLHALRSIKLVDLTSDRVSVWLKNEAARRPTQAALAFRLLRAFLNWCQFQDEYKDIAKTDACGKKGREYLPKKQVKTDCLQREQLAAWFCEVRKIRNPIISAYLQSLLLTGTRREELAGLTWDCVDFQWNGLHIRDKVEGERVIPLTPYVSHLLSALPRRNKWVFSSPQAESGRLQEPRLQHNAALAAAGLPPLTLHGLRRSFGTLCEWVETPAGISAQLMGHKPSATAEKHYRQRPLDLLRTWHTKIEAWFLEQTGIDFSPLLSQSSLKLVNTSLSRCPTKSLKHQPSFNGREADSFPDLSGYAFNEN